VNNFSGSTAITVIGKDHHRFEIYFTPLGGRHG